VCLIQCPYELNNTESGDKMQLLRDVVRRFIWMVSDIDSICYFCYCRFRTSYGRKSVKIGLQTWGSDGDIRPFLALAGGLRAAGHDVSLVVTSVDNKNYQSIGAELDIPVRHTRGPGYDDAMLRMLADKLIRSRDPLAQIRIVLEFAFYPLVPDMFSASQKLCAANDLVIGHFIHTPLHTAAELSGKPHVSVMLNHIGIYSKHVPIFGVPQLGLWLNPFWHKLISMMMDRFLGPHVNALRKSVNLPMVQNISETVWTSRTLNLLAESSALCHKQPDWPQYHHVCGFFELPDASEPWTLPEDLKRFLDAGSPPIYMSVGSMLSLDPEPEIITSTLVQGALLAGCRAIVQSRWNDLPDFPDHSQIYKIHKTPHQHIFPLCSAVVHHGGAGTSHTATLHGCPSIVIEHVLDQQFFADTLQKAGVAPKALHRRTITAQKLAKTIKEVLSSPDMKKRAEELGSRMKQENGVKMAVELIEQQFAG